MEQLNLDAILGRTGIASDISELLRQFELNKHDIARKRGIYVYGRPGCGKSVFVRGILERLGYDIIWYDAGDIRNKTIIETITKHNMGDRSVMSLFERKARPIAIVMDEIDGMNSGDKGGINTLIKLMRPKKTKKQRSEGLTAAPIICISNYHMDKKIKELMKVCAPFELSAPTDKHMYQILDRTMPELSHELAGTLVAFLRGDLRKVALIHQSYSKHCSSLKNELVTNVLRPRGNGEDTKETAARLLTQPVRLEEHLTTMNETDRTIVGLLWHENVIDLIADVPAAEACPFYGEVLRNICFADYVDRVTFQKQIWVFNELSSLLKTFRSAHLLRTTLGEHPQLRPPGDIRFTKVLTKYSTEYNNYTFLQEMCQRLSMDKKDLLSFFAAHRSRRDDPDFLDELASCDIAQLDINRLYRYLDWFAS